MPKKDAGHSAHHSSLKTHSLRLSNSGAENGQKNVGQKNSALKTGKIFLPSIFLPFKPAPSDRLWAVRLLRPPLHSAVHRVPSYRSGPSITSTMHHAMTATELIQKLIKDTIRRAIQESIAALIVIAAFAHYLQQAPVGSAQYYGCLVILIGCGFITGVIWSFALSYRLLRVHPATDTAFWQEAFRAQAQLLRFVPLWYLAPLCTGMLLFDAPTAPGQHGSFLISLAVVTLIFASITWLNRHAAAKIEANAQALAA